MHRIRSFPVTIRILALLLAASCVADSDRDAEEPFRGVVPYTEGTRIAWDYRTLTRVYDGPVFYPRMIRVQNGDLLCAFESEGGIYIVRSPDEGQNWQPAERVAPPDGDVLSAVPELIQLDNGRIVLAYNPRPPAENHNPDLRFGIKTRVSDDGGVTWTEPQNVFEGGYTWGRGVWEPVMIQLESGEIQLFFANEYPYPNSNDQEISMVQSTDNGESWSVPQTISYRPGHRDGMPVPLILQDDKGIAVAIEDNGIDSSEFKPVVIWNSDGNWPEAAGAATGRRWRALTDSEQLSSADYGGAPYLRQLPSGETVLSFQSTEGRSGGWSKSTMVVAIGDGEAKNFSRKSEPFRVPEGRSALWNSLFIKNDTTVTAVTSTTAYSSSGRRELYIKDGYVQRGVKASHGTPVVDGRLDEAIWKQSRGVFLGADSPARAHITAAWDEEKLYLGYSVTDPSLSESPERTADRGDGVSVMLATGLLSEDRPVEGSYKIYSSASGKTEIRKGENGSWVDHEMPVDASVKISDTEERYQLEIALPWTAVDGRPDTTAGWGINFELVNYNPADSSLSREVISASDGHRPSTWMKIQLKGN